MIKINNSLTKDNSFEILTKLYNKKKEKQIEEYNRRLAQNEEINKSLEKYKNDALLIQQSNDVYGLSELPITLPKLKNSNIFDKRNLSVSF